MKWGVRRYQDKSGRLTAAGKQHVKDRRVNKKIEEYIKAGKAKVSDLEHYSVAGLTEFITKTGEKYVSGLINGHDFDWQETTYISGYGAKNPAEHMRDFLDMGEENPFYAESSKDKESHLAGRLTDKDMKNCNFGYGKPGTVQNCVKCAANLELNLRGIPTVAGRQTFPSSVDAPSLWFKDAKRVDYDYDTAEEALKSYGSKTSGILSFQYGGNKGGHSVHWTNDKDGIFEIQDGQNGRRFKSLSEMMDEYGGSKEINISTFRLDNCEPDYDHMAQDSVLRGDYVHNKFTNQDVDTW